MKLADLERHLRAHGCVLYREGSRHAVWWNPITGKAAAVPRHREIRNPNGLGHLQGVGSAKDVTLSHSQAPAWECTCPGRSFCLNVAERSRSFVDNCVPKLKLGTEEKMRVNKSC